MTRTFARNAFPRITTSKNLRRVEKRHTLGQAAEQEGRIDFTTAFDQDARDIFPGKSLQ